MREKRREKEGLETLREARKHSQKKKKTKGKQEVEYKGNESPFHKM